MILILLKQFVLNKKTYKHLNNKYQMVLRVNIYKYNI